MGIFGNMFNTAGIGDWNPQSLPQDPRIAQSLKPGFFGSGKAASLLEILGDGFSGTDDYQRRMMQQKQQQQEDERWQKRFDLERNKPQVINRGKNGVSVVNPATMEVTDLVQPTEDKTPLQQNIEYLHSLNPGMTPEQLAEIAQRGIQGYNLSPEALAARAAEQRGLIDYRTNAAATLKGAPTYAATHPKPAKGGGGQVVTHKGRKFAQVGGQWMEITQ